ncbi:carbohydrate-binding protein [Adhaeretor mobilis]|uniref:Carbohydrate binding module (Family 6) n=1 Tax=Adhaeretor mobilis TaxID=1930276 RepID=A0A517MTS2_9BACT|nr:carbohydrate-binding protein [Adhaeretor mobilis]QDS98280.1 Carbohydrate binding module (family 6) [Adhaeretor mobilis]
MFAAPVSYRVVLSQLITIVATLLFCGAVQAQSVYCSGSIQSCMDAMSAAGGGSVILEDKTYFLTQSIIPKSNVNLIGQGTDTVITWAPSVADSINEPMIVDDGNTALVNIGFSDFRMLGTVDTSDPNDRDRSDHMAIFFNGPGDPAVASSLRHHNITVANLEVSQFGGTGIHIKGSNNLTTFDLNMYDNGWFPTDLFHNLYLLRVRNVTMIQTDSDAGFRESPSGHGLRMSSLENVYFEGLIVEGNADHGIHMNNVTNMTGYDITSEDNCQDLLGSCGNVRCYGDQCDFDFNLSQPQDPYYFAEVQAPFMAHQIPGVIEAEAFDVGGDNFAYSDTSSGNSFGDGAGNRNTDVDLVELNAGNYKVGFIDDGEWLEYTTDLDAGNYRVDFLASSNQAAGGEVELVIDGISYGTTDISSTGSWNNFQTFSLNDVTIANDSTSVIRLNMGGDGFDLDSFTFVETLAGDYDLDFDIDGADFLIWQKELATEEGLTAWQGGYGTGAPLSAIQVPEPMSGLLLLVVAAWCQSARIPRTATCSR